MAITYEDRLRDSGHFDITPEQEREIEAREECARRGIDTDEICADGGVVAWMVVDKEGPDNDWFSQIVGILLKHGMLDERSEYDLNDVMAALADNYEPTTSQA